MIPTQTDRAWRGHASRALLAAAGWLAVMAGIGANFVAPDNTRAVGPAFAVLAGITTAGSRTLGVTSMACYGACPGQGPHPANYTKAADMGAGTGTPSVYLQLDYLPSNVNGGYVLAYRDPISNCGQKDSPYNGRMITVEIFHFVNGTYTNWQYESYLHIDPHSSVSTYKASATWLKWNNAWASSPMWPGIPAADFNLNNLTSGGKYLGSVHNVTTPDQGCTAGNHLHQEADTDGQYAPNLAIGNSTTARWADVHYVTLAGINGQAP